jgi:holin-like protein
MSVLKGLIALLACQVLGELLVVSFEVPVPGPVVGMLLMLALLQVRRPRPESGLVRAPQTLLRHLPLLYVPAGVGVVAHLGRLGGDALPIAGGLVLSWLGGLVVTAAVAALGLRLTSRGRVTR